MAKKISRRKLGSFVRLVGSENRTDIAVFDIDSLALYTGRGPYAYNFSKDELRKHMERLIDTFNEHLERVWAGEITKDNVEEKIERDDRKIRWDITLKYKLLRLRRKQAYKEENVYPAFYRPFVPMWVYFDKVFNAGTDLLPSIFPTPNTENLVIVVCGGRAEWFDAFITDRIVDHGFMSATHLFPLYIYTEVKTLYGTTFQKQYNIPDKTLELVQKALNDPTITKEDIFFYVFGVFSTPSYVEKVRNTLSTAFPRVPILDSFREISKVGKQLAEAQLVYQRYVWAVVMREERAKLLEYLNLTITADENSLKQYVERVRLDKENREITINGKIKVQGIPEFALKCMVGNYPPIEWVSRYLVREEDKETGIAWDPRLRVEEFIDIVKKLVIFSGICLEIKEMLDGLWNLALDNQKASKQAGKRRSGMSS